MDQKILKKIADTIGTPFFVYDGQILNRNLQRLFDAANKNGLGKRISIFVAYFIAYATDIVALEPWNTIVNNIAIAKTDNSFFVNFLRGIGANWLVCLALWMGISAQHTTGKIVGLWWPIMAFVTLGLEHSIANMFFIPLAMFNGADVSFFSFLIDNLLPVTLGNIVGGAFFVGTLYWVAYEKE